MCNKVPNSQRTVEGRKRQQNMISTHGVLAGGECSGVDFNSCAWTGEAFPPVSGSFSVNAPLRITLHLHVSQIKRALRSVSVLRWLGMSRSLVHSMSGSIVFALNLFTTTEFPHSGISHFTNYIKYAFCKSFHLYIITVMYSLPKGFAAVTDNRRCKQGSRQTL